MASAFGVRNSYAEAGSIPSRLPPFGLSVLSKPTPAGEALRVHVTITQFSGWRQFVGVLC